jgi:hypothetical protein
MKRRDQIEEIIREFDFKRVRKAMAALDWEWFGKDGTPTVRAMKKLARGLLKDVSRARDADTIGTGGFEARRYADGTLLLCFIVAERFVDKNGEAF